VLSNKKFRIFSLLKLDKGKENPEKHPLRKNY
jgi:hypothetical protein